MAYQHRSTLAVVLTTVGLLVACQDDRRPMGGFDVQDAGDVEDATDVELDSEPDARDAGRDGDGMTSDEPYVFPGEPPEGTHCNEAGWCWIHPSPFPHEVTDLKESAEEIHGVAVADELGGFRPFVWNADGVQILDSRFIPLADSDDMAPAGDGWLTVSHSGDVQAFSTEGTRQELAGLPSDGYVHISGASQTRYLAKKSNGGGTLVIDGDMTSSEDFPGKDPTLRMWSNGEVWGVDDVDEPDREAPPNWNLLSDPQANEGRPVTGLGPGPTASCVDVGWWAQTQSVGIAGWLPDRDPVEFTGTSFPAVAQFACDARGNPMGVDAKGGIQRLTPDRGWFREEFADYALVSSAADSETTYVGGNYGTLLEVTGDAVERLSGGFRVPTDQMEADGDPMFRDLWVNDAGTKVHLAYASGAHRATEEVGWRELFVPTLPDGDGSSRAGFTVVGDQSPAFAIVNGALMEWVGNGWRNDDLGDLDEFAEDIHDIAGTRSDLWATSGTTILHYDGSEWARVTDAPIDSPQLELHRTDNGDIFAIAQEDIIRLDGGPEDLSLELAYEPPCSQLTAMHQSADGTVLASGQSLCIARYADGSWTELTAPPHRDTLPANGERIEEFIEQPGDRPVLAVTEAGILAVGADGQLRSEFPGVAIDAEYLPEHDALWALTPYGVVAKYY